MKAARITWKRCSDIDTGDDSTSRLQMKEQGIQCKHGAKFTKLNNDDDVDTGVEVRIQSQGAVLTVTQEGPEHNHTYVDNTRRVKESTYESGKPCQQMVQ